MDRRAWLVRLSAIGIGGVAFQRALAHKIVVANAVSSEMIQDAQWIADVELTDAEKDGLCKELQEQLNGDRKLQLLKLDTDVGPASAFVPYFFAENLVEENADANKGISKSKLASKNRIDPSWGATKLAEQVDWKDELSVAGSGILAQAAAIRSGATTSLRLTELYLDRIKRFDPMLRCVVTLTESHAMEQAKRADQELASGNDRGLLHGIPWGAKDIIAVPPFPTTWGGKPYREQVRPNMATVAQRLNDAGAVMLGKLAVGTYAMGDIWYDATTKNPWNVAQGSSGSSAGSASAVAAGLCTFALGSETLGSIVSPSRRCRVMGMRPSFGRVSRYGCMPLSWTMDKIGPIARHAIDTGVVLSAIQGADGKDPTAVDRALQYPGSFDLSKLRIGITDKQLSASERVVLGQLRSDGATIVEIEYPDTIPQDALLVALEVESAAVFDALIRTSTTDDDFGLWGESFRKAQFARGIHYIQSLRARSLLIQETERVLRNVDLVLGGEDLLRTNLTGHPSMIVRCGSQEQRIRSNTSESNAEEAAEDTPEPKNKMVPRTIKLTSRYFADGILIAMGDYIQRKLPAEPHLPVM
jgi:Asp-tRNA(Asn)/Glu-tRNA(Gln) amidotransferase A subunit family amidase